MKKDKGNWTAFRGMGNATQKGSVTIYLVLTMMLVLAVVFTTLEALRGKELRLLANENADQALESVFAQYHQEIFARYRLFFYELPWEEEADFSEVYESFKQTAGIAFAPVSTGKNAFLFHAGLADVQIDRYMLATDCGGEAFLEQAVECAKVDTAADALEGVVSFLTDAQSQEQMESAFSGIESDALAALEQIETENTGGEAESGGTDAEAGTAAESGVGTSASETAGVSGVAGTAEAGESAAAAEGTAAGSGAGTEAGTVAGSGAGTEAGTAAESGAGTEAGTAAGSGAGTEAGTADESAAATEVETSAGSGAASGTGNEVARKYGNPLTFLKQLQKNGILSFVTSSPENLSSLALEEEELLTGRELHVADTSAAGSLDAGDKIWLLRYLDQYFGCYGNVKESALSYEQEFLVAGKASDTGNLKAAVTRLLNLRAACNYAVIQKDAEKSELAGVVAASVCGAAAVPALTGAVKQGILLAWAYGESILDVRTLLEGGKIAFFKTSEEWTLDLEQLSKIGTGWQKAKESENGLDYQNYMQLFLLLLPEETVAMRCLALIEANMNQTEGVEHIQMDNMVFEMEGTFTYEAEPLFLQFVPQLGNRDFHYSITETSTYSYRQ